MTYMIAVLPVWPIATAFIALSLWAIQIIREQREYRKSKR